MIYIRTLTFVGIICSAASAQYDPPAGYYESATGTGPTLKNQLHDIIDNHVERSYEDAKSALQILDEDPNNTSNIILIYNGDSVLSTWDAGSTWNREHQWPRSLGVGNSGPDYTDLIALRPCNPGVNSSRSNKPFGLGSGYWDPDALSPPEINDRGDAARTIFYMAVRYDGSDSDTADLEIVNGFPGTNQMGDLAKILEWHYSDPVDDIELRRNHLVWSSQDNPLYWQGNRNPFIDRPEFVWTIFGTSDNDSTLYVGGSVPGDGSSADSVLFELIVDGPAPADSVALNKVGNAPTTYNVSLSGDVLSSSAGTGQAFSGGAQSGSINVTIADTSNVGQLGGTITIDNSDLTSAGTGQGSNDGDDVITITADILDHAEASFNDSVDQNELTIDFGSISTGGGVLQIVFTIYNLESTAGFTAALDVDSTSGTGDTATLFTDLAPVSDVAAGQGQQFIASFDPSAGEGSYQAIYAISVSDENLAGAVPGGDITLTLIGQAELPVPTLSQWCTVAMTLLLAIGGTIVFRRRKVETS